MHETLINFHQTLETNNVRGAKKPKIIPKLAVIVDVFLLLFVTNNTIVAKVNSKILGTIKAQIPTQL